MATSCIYRPLAVNKNGKEVESKLYDGLEKMSGDRNFAIGMWALANSAAFKAKYKDMERDENGEVTARAMDKKFHLVDNLLGGVSPQKVLEDLGAVEADGKAKTFRTVNEIAPKVVDYNNAHQNTVATVTPNGKGYQVNAEKLSLHNANDNIRLAYGMTLFDNLRGMLRQLGFDVAFMDDPRFNGVFNPMSAERTADMFSTVIQIARGQRGVEAMPEEFAHMAIAGLANHPLVQRLLSSIDNEQTLKEILGDEYETYDKLYGGDHKTLVSEAAGKLLGEQIRQRYESAATQGTRNLAQRIWDWVKGLFVNSDVNIDTISDDARMAAYSLAGSVLDGSILPLIDNALVIGTGSMYSVASEAKNMADIALKGYEQIRQNNFKTRLGDKEMSRNMTKEVDDLLTNHQYTLGTCKILLEMNRRIKWLRDTYLLGMDRGMFAPSADLQDILTSAHLIRDIDIVVKDFKPLLEDMMMLDKFEVASVISAKSLKKIMELANEGMKVINRLDTETKNAKFGLMYSYLTHFWQGDVTIDVGPLKGQTLTLQMLMCTAMRDSGKVENLFDAMSVNSDALLSLIDRAYKTHRYGMENSLKEVDSKVRALEEWRVKKKFKTDFMFGRNAEGKLTGKYICPVDIDRYLSERANYADQVRATNPDTFTFNQLMLEWDREHEEWVVVDEDTGRGEYMPRLDMYGLSGVQSHLDFEGMGRALGLSDDEVSYYKQMMDLKIKADTLIGRSDGLFTCVQVRKDNMEILMDRSTNPLQKLKMFMTKIKDAFVAHNNDTEYGMMSDDKSVTEEERLNAIKNGRPLLLGLDGEPLKGVPTWYTHQMKDPDMLSTDVGSTMLAYTSMAYNFNMCDEIMDMFSILKDANNERLYLTEDDRTPLQDTFNFYGVTLSKRMMPPLKKTNSQEKLDGYIDNVIYGITKQVQKWGIINLGKIGDWLRNYSTRLGLSLNLQAGIGNVNAGIMQMVIEGFAGKYYGLKDFLWANMAFFKYIATTIGDTGSANPQSKMTLMMEKYDGMQEYVESLSRNRFYNNRMQRILGRGSLMFMMTAGEYYLHTCNMLALFNNKKVLVNGKETTFWKAHETYRNEDGTVGVRIVDGATDLDGNAIDDSFINQQKFNVRQVGQACNGAYSSIDYGNAQKNVFFRLILGFRQWMIRHATRRFGGTYYDASLGENVEGYYRTLGRLFWNFGNELAHGRFHMAVAAFSGVSTTEMQNIKRALMELSQFVIRNLVLMLIPWKDPKEMNVLEKIAYYTYLRQMQELSQFIPWVSGFKNVLNMLDNPIAATRATTHLIDLCNIGQIGIQVQQGRYQGWDKYVSYCAKLVPGFDNAMRILDIPKSTSMFAAVQTADPRYNKLQREKKRAEKEKKKHPNVKKNSYHPIVR